MILFQRTGHEVKLNKPRDVSWEEVMTNASDTDCVEMNSNEFAYILYTPVLLELQRVVRDIGGI